MIGITSTGRGKRLNKSPKTALNPTFQPPTCQTLAGQARSRQALSAIERKLAKLEEQKADLEQQMAAHDPSDYEGLGKLNDQLQAVTDESEELELEWMELSEQLE